MLPDPPVPVPNPAEMFKFGPTILVPAAFDVRKVPAEGVALPSASPIIRSPILLMVARVFWLSTLKTIESVVPTPEVDSRVSVDEAAVPPITSGVVTDVPTVGDAVMLGTLEPSVLRIPLASVDNPDTVDPVAA